MKPEVVRKAGKTGATDFTAPLIGLPFSHIWRGYGSAILLEFGELKPRKRKDGSPANPVGEMTLMIEWSWRVEGPRSILCGSSSKEKFWSKAFEKMHKAKVADVSLFGRIPEIEVRLDSDLRVLSFSAVEGQPHWTLFNRRSGEWLNVRRGTLYIAKSTK